jgi:RNA polymerase sigma factor (sigma-70 family)
MDSDSSSLVTIVLDCRSRAGHSEAIENFAASGLVTSPVLAWRMILRYHVVDPAFGPDDALQSAFLKLWRAFKAGKLESVETEADFAKLFLRKLNQKILDERARQRGQKVGVPGANDGDRPAAMHDLDDDLDAIDSPALPPDEQVMGNDRVEWMLGLLALEDPSLRLVAMRKAEGYTHEEIACLLGQSLSTIERRVRQVKAILEARIFEPD